MPRAAIADDERAHGLSATGVGVPASLGTAPASGTSIIGGPPYIVMTGFGPHALAVATTNAPNATTPKRSERSEAQLAKYEDGAI